LETEARINKGKIRSNYMTRCYLNYFEMRCAGMVAAAFTTGKRSVNYRPSLPSPFTPLPLLSNLKRNNLGLDNYALCIFSRHYVV
jgi:hypothetical protein